MVAASFGFIIRETMIWFRWGGKNSLETDPVPELMDVFYAW